MNANKETWHATYTDTFGGELNYSWVRRYSFTVPAGAKQAAIMRAAKRAAGLSGMRGKVDSYGDSFTFYPWGYCTALVVEYVPRGDA
jgi:hypothetical protein